MLSKVIIPFKKDTNEEKILLIQGGEEELRNSFIKDHQSFVKKIVSRVCKRYIDSSMDEYSVGLLAFNESIDEYTNKKGSSFLTFSNLVIRRRLIDYIRKEANTQNPYPIDEQLGENMNGSLTVKASITKYSEEMINEFRKDELEVFKSQLKGFDITFTELLKISPKHFDARRNAIDVAKKITDCTEIREYLFQKKRLPMKKVEGIVDVSRKTLERNRKYIIALVIVMTEDYRYLKEYLTGI